MATNVANRSGRRGVTSKWCAELRQALALANREGGVYSVQARTPSNSIVKFVLLKQPLSTRPALVFRTREGHLSGQALAWPVPPGALRARHARRARFVVSSLIK